MRRHLLDAIAPDDAAAVEGCFRDALAIARRQGARLLELRAARSLARHWAESGRRADGAALLADVLAGFSEGFDTLDLREAAALLAGLTAAQAPGGSTARTST